MTNLILGFRRDEIRNLTIQTESPIDWTAIKGVHKGELAPVKRFVSPKTALGDLDAEAAAALIAAAADITLVLDTGGMISDLAVRTDDLAADLRDPETWLGKSFASIAAPDSRTKVAGLIADAASNTETRWRHVNHPTQDGRFIPILYCCVQLEGARLVAFGPRSARPLRAAAASRRRAAEHGARLHPHARRRDALSPAVPALLRGRS